MTISRRVLSRILQGGLLAATLLFGAANAAGQQGPVNPLRQPQRVAEKLTVAEMSSRTAPPDTASPSVATASHQRAAQDTSAVRQAAYGVPVTTRRPTVTPATYGSLPGQIVARTEPELVPTPSGGSTAGSSSGRIPREGEVIYEGVFDSTPGGPVMYGSGDLIGGELLAGGDCLDCETCPAVPCATICFDNVSLFAGVQGFTGPLNRGGSGSFGFHEGVNWGFGLPLSCGALAGQIGMRATQSNLSGTAFTDGAREQMFLTGGIFRRVDWGLQGGLVIDYLSQEWYANTDFTQLRGEISWVFPCTHEIGFWFTAGTQGQTKQSTFTGDLAAALEPWTPTDLYAFFYRHRFEGGLGAEARGSFGFSGSGDGYIGTDVHLPLGMNFALDTGFAYLIPRQSAGTAGGGHEQESWNIAITLVWQPGGMNGCGPNYFRPLFNVADNGVFMFDRR